MVSDVWTSQSQVWPISVRPPVRPGSAANERVSSVMAAYVLARSLPSWKRLPSSTSALTPAAPASALAMVDELAEYDAIIVGTGTRYGRMTSQMANFWDQTGGLWAQGKLIGKVGAAFTSTASQHGGQETTLMGIHTNLLHHGMVIVGLPYSFQGQLKLDEITGGSPYGATTIAAGDGSRQPTENELEGARFLGRHVAQVTAKLAA